MIELREALKVLNQAMNERKAERDLFKATSFGERYSLVRTSHADKAADTLLRQGKVLNHLRDAVLSIEKALEVEEPKGVPRR